MRQVKKVQPKEVWSAWVRYEENPQKGKYRPVLVVDVADDKALVLSVPITSSQPWDEYDIGVFDWADIPLDHFSTACVSHVLAIPIADFCKRLGVISDDDWQMITDLLMQYMEHHEIP